MLAKLKLAAYGLLVVLALWFAWGFYVNYTAVTISSAVADPEASIGAPAQTQDSAATPNDSASSTNASAQNPDAGTNADLAASTTAVAASESDTNQPDAAVTAADPDSTNSISATNPAPAKVTKKAKKSRKVVDVHQSVRVATAETRTAMIGYLVKLVLVMALLGGLIAYDFTRNFAHKAVDMLFDDDHTPAVKDPEYERAEQVWAEGRPMEAIEIMRAHLKKNPREQYVALRIAEIYEKDFRNYLAAAMEIEEVLKHKLHPDRWGWTAIHLCNLYSKLGRQADYDALLNRIVKEFPHTSAAIKARKVLGLPEENMESDESQSTNVQILQGDPTWEPPADSSEGNSNLPRGFRPKK